MAGRLRARRPRGALGADGEAGVAFEVQVAGTMRGESFTQRLCLVFEVRDGLVHHFREYLAWPGGLR
ncbi:hypothetical protein [Dactylosporangium cerinum]